MEPAPRTQPEARIINDLVSEPHTEDFDASCSNVSRAENLIISFAYD